MSRHNVSLSVALFRGDGIGPEVIDPCVDLLTDICEQTAGLQLNFTPLDAGADLYQRTGTALPDESIDAAAGADAILLSAMGDPKIRYPDGREIAPQVDLRERLELFAGVRPIRTYPGLPVPLADRRAQSLDLVLIREQTEGMFAARQHGVVEDDTVARDSIVVTRAGSERVFDFAFDLARRRKADGHPGHVTCVDKANVLRSFAFFQDVFKQRAAAHPDIGAHHCYVDAMAMNLVKQPWRYDVIVTENMFGDILSDVGAALMGGMGMAASADIGKDHAVFQPCHGTAPDIVGQGKANPTAMFLSAALMLEWLGDRHDLPDAGRAGRQLHDAVEHAFRDGTLRPFELGGTDGTTEITKRVRRHLGALVA